MNIYQKQVCSLKSEKQKIENKKHKRYQTTF